MLDVASTEEYYSIYHKQAKIFITDSMTHVELDEAFVPGAQLEEPLEAHTVEALRMWLVCHGVEVSGSLKKAQLIAE